MPDLPHSVSPADLIRFDFDESTAEAAAQEIAELVHAIFGPSDPEVAEGWALSQEEDLSAIELRDALAKATQAADPVACLADAPDARAMLERGMRLRWSSRRARVLSRPESLEGQTWSSLSEEAQAEVREALEELMTYANSRVLRYRPERGDLDTFLSELAEIYVRHLRRGDPGLRTRRLLRRTDVPHSPRSRFIQLADLTLSRLSRRLPDDLRLHPGWRSVRGLSDRWKRRKENEVFGRRERNAKSKDGSPA